MTSHIPRPQERQEQFSAAEERKRSKYHDLLTTRNFVAVVVETLGGFDPETSTFMTERLADASGGGGGGGGLWEPEGTMERFLLQLLNTYNAITKCGQFLRDK